MKNILIKLRMKLMNHTYFNELLLHIMKLRKIRFPLLKFFFTIYIIQLLISNRVKIYLSNIYTVHSVYRPFLTKLLMRIFLILFSCLTIIQMTANIIRFRLLIIILYIYIIYYWYSNKSWSNDAGSYVVVWHKYFLNSE